VRCLRTGLLPWVRASNRTLARGLLLDQIAFLDERITQRTSRAVELAAAMPAA